MPRKRTTLTDLTWGDLESWAGGKILGRGKSYLKNVRDLRRTPESELIAWVDGSERYATHVWADTDGGLQSECSCPYDWGGPCKHAVAVVLAYLDAVKEKREIPATDANDPRFESLDEALEDSEDFDDEDEDDDWDDEYEDGEDDEPDKKVRVARSGRRENEREKTVRAYLSEMNKDALVKFALEMVADRPDIEKDIVARKRMAGGKWGKVVESLRSDILSLTAEFAWQDHRRGRGHRPDYSVVERRMNDLHRAGRADDLVSLGKELLERGVRQVAQSDDEGETGMAIGACMKIAFQAVTQSSLSAPDQLLWMIDAFLDDEYCILEDVSAPFEDKRYKKADWSRVADALLDRLVVPPKLNAPEGRSDEYRRKRIMSHAIDALKHAGRKDEVLPLMQREAPHTQCYEDVVDALISEKHDREAKEWAIRGYNETREKWAGIAHNLLDRIRLLETKARNFPAVAAYRAVEFFATPSLGAYLAAQKDAERAKLWQPVREALLRYLETGIRPDEATPAPVRPAQKGKKAATLASTNPSNWPLPAVEVEIAKVRDLWQKFPRTATLIEIAIHEKRIDDAVELYRHFESRLWHSTIADKVADTAQDAHPDLSLDIWRKRADALIAETKPSAYHQAAHYFKKAKSLCHRTKRDNEFRDYIAHLRVKHKPKRRLMEVLDAVEDKRILDI
ncbi:SWIM zinc finger domain-containing protein [Candidatus Sumerlaeota bacterium]|nr:SWIM zinc finger domain-containing protein [Candidatus Sumerlaeota bacterium]